MFIMNTGNRTDVVVGVVNFSVIATHEQMSFAARYTDRITRHPEPD